MAHNEQEMANMDERSAEKALDSHVEDISHARTTTQMRSKSDDVSVWQSMMQHKLVGLVAMSAAFSASLDGYRECSAMRESIMKGVELTFYRDHTEWRYRFQQGVYPAVRNVWYNDHRWQVYLSLGRYSICWPDDRPSSE